MPFTKVPMQPGVYLDDSPTEVEGYWVDADKIRFVRGLPQTFAGWESYSSTLLNGRCRGLHSWGDNTGIKWAQAGTHLQLYTLNDGQVYDCTPITARNVQSALHFTTDGVTPAVTMMLASHGLIAGQRFSLLNSQYSTLGGTTFAGTYIVNSANLGLSTLTYNAATSSTSAITSVAALSDLNVFLAPGLQDGAAGAGYGTGYYSGSVGTGTTYGTPTTGVNYPRTWSIDNFGQNAIASPRGGGIFEFSPTTSNPELTTNGNFSNTSLSWTAGAGWTFGSGVVAAANASSSLFQDLTVQAAAYFEIEYTLSSVTGGSIFAAFGPTTLSNSTVSSARIKTQAWSGPSGACTLSFNATSLTGNISSVTVTQLLNAQIIPAAPVNNTCMIVTAERFVMVGGTIVISTGLFNPMHLRWSNINDEQTWVPNPLVPNLSSFYTLGEGSRIVGMALCGTQILVFTDTALYVGTYSSDVGVIYSFQLAGTGCGLIGCNAKAVIGGVAYWMSPQGTTFVYSGGVPQILRSTMSQDMFNNLAFVQQDKIFASSVSQYGDVIFLYPDERDGTNECSRYALLCASESGPNPTFANAVGIWVPGTFTRTAWIDGGVLEFPLAVDADGTIYYQEKGNSGNGGPIDWTLQTGDIQLGNGDTSFSIQSFIPDFATLVGGCAMSIVTKLYPQAIPITHGPYNITSSSTKVDLMSDAPVGRNASFVFNGMASPAQMRSGHLMYVSQDTGQVF